MADQEHRRVPRVKRSFMIRYRSATGPLSWGLSPLRDLSDGGARFMSETSFAVGDELLLELLLPVSKEPIPITARVAWAKAGPMAVSEYGVRFHVQDERIRQALAEAVTRFTSNVRGN